MANPGIGLGNLNRLLGSVLFASNPALNVTPSYLGKDAMSWEPQGQSGTMLPGLVGGIPSPEPYMIVRVTVHLLKSIPLSNAWIAQVQQSVLIGDATMSFDSAALGKQMLSNCQISNPGAITTNGLGPDVPLMFEGTWSINAGMWP